MCPCAARAARTARASSTPSRRSSSSATTAEDGTESVTRRQRERMVGARSSAEGAHSIHTVDGGGSSMDFSSTLKVPAVMRSASSTITTRCRPVAGDRWAVITSARTSSFAIESLSVATTVTSGWVPERVVRQARHCPQPLPSSHCRVAAKARAAVERPEPGGPVTNQACAREPSGEAARRNWATAASCPTTSAHTPPAVTLPEPAAPGPSAPGVPSRVAVTARPGAGWVEPARRWGRTGPAPRRRP